MRHLAFLLLTTSFALSACTHAPVTLPSVPAVQSIDASTYDMGAPTGGSLVLEAPGSRQVMAFAEEVKRFELVLKRRQAGSDEVVLQGITLTPQDGKQRLSILNVPPGTYTLHIAAINLADQPVQVGAPQLYQAEPIEVKPFEVSYIAVSVPLMETALIPWGVFKPSQTTRSSIRPETNTVIDPAETKDQDPLSTEDQAPGVSPATGALDQDPSGDGQESAQSTEDEGAKAEEQAPAGEEPAESTHVEEPQPSSDEQVTNTEEGNS